jgi:hypothetical protein
MCSDVSCLRQSNNTITVQRSVKPSVDENVKITTSPQLIELPHRHPLKQDQRNSCVLPEPTTRRTSADPSRLTGAARTPQTMQCVTRIAIEQHSRLLVVAGCTRSLSYMVVPSCYPSHWAHQALDGPQHEPQPCCL